MKNLAILVNTCDKFEDCWDPFFKLFSIYWPNYKGKIYLNTEYKDYTYGNLNIISLKVCEEKKGIHNITWSECLKRALSLIEEDIVLYMQEDYFLNSSVNVVKIKELAERMTNDKIDCIHLTDQNSVGPVKHSTYKDLWLIERNASYRISCQAALWKKSVLREYLRAHENPWQFEKFATQRSIYLNHKFYCVNRNLYKIKENEMIPYVFTGIIQGRWYEEVVDLFNKYDIEVNYSKRGFVKDRKITPLKIRFKRRIKTLPGELKSLKEIYKMKFLLTYNSIRYTINKRPM